MEVPLSEPEETINSRVVMKQNHPYKHKDKAYVRLQTNSDDKQS